MTDVKLSPIADYAFAGGDRLALDPGPEISGWMLWNVAAGGEICIKGAGCDRNINIRKWIANQKTGRSRLDIETPAPRGMPTAAEEMETLIQIGRFLQMWSNSWSYVFRREVKLHICGDARAKDPHVRQAIIDRFGGDAEAIGGKRCRRCKGQGVRGKKHEKCDDCEGGGWQQPPGPLYGVTSHAWAAMAIALYCFDTDSEPVRQIAGTQGKKQKAAKRTVRSRSVPEGGV